MIHILEDIKLDKAETLQIVGKVNRNLLLNVDKIGKDVQVKSIPQEQVFSLYLVIYNQSDI